ncbi:zinc finger BED domain-containing protein RICESLEEPER 2-like [Canna indica]|uniref:Zinc finger BED domain-containing protein RICESLEEPER 2-like n=1 Tax=Canna indica TaxID=4628 RepID=A0AAQ3QFN1_9LILI|nr:zinc finger BED domain-containing protein RICESLEEPER 2-like [Canna indica]
MANEEVDVENAIGVNNDNQVVNLAEDNANEDNPFEKRKRKKISGVWNEFTIIKLSNGTTKYEMFNMVMKFSNPAYEKISRAIVKGDCITSYQMEKKRLMALLKTTNRVSITTYCWRLGQNIQYMVVTYHFVDSDWKLQKRIINFINVIGSTGVVILDALFKCLQECELEKKVFTITMDNASYNDSVVRMLKDNISVFKKLSLN